MDTVRGAAGAGFMAIVREQIQPSDDPGRAERIARERREARAIMEDVASGAMQGQMYLVKPDHDDPEGTPPEVQVFWGPNGSEFILTIEPADGWESDRGQSYEGRHRR